MANSLPQKHLFDLPDGVIYLDGNSLGPICKSVPDHVETVMRDQWGEMLIRGWNQAGWMEQPTRVGDKIGRLIGAQPGTVVAGDTLTIKVYQALAAALELRPDRRIVLSDNGNFPTDLYMAQGLLRSLDRGYELRVVDPEAVVDAIDETVAAVLLTEVDYRTGRKHSIQDVTAKAHQAGAVMVWDLAHSAGAFEVDITSCNAEFAVGCTYKYLNGGPGAPAFIYVRPDLIEQVRPALAGWLGHDMPFAFEQDYRPAGSIERMRVGTPSVLQMSALEKSLELWDSIEMADIRQASVELCELFIAKVEQSCPELTLASPRNSDERGSQVSFAFEHGYAAMQAVIARGVIGDFRAPNIMRFGFTPLYVDQSDVVAAVEIIATVMRDRLWDNPIYKAKSRVT